jgi:hypothetical protein
MEHTRKTFNWEAFDLAMGDTSECNGLLEKYLNEKEQQRASITHTTVNDNNGEAFGFPTD